MAFCEGHPLNSGDGLLLVSYSSEVPKNGTFSLEIIIIIFHNTFVVLV
jgi:hypothetical protein